MRAVLRLAGHELRARWLGWVALALLVGLAGGVVLTAAAGARRTDSAYPRFLAVSKASDVLIGPASNGTGGYDDALARLPGVAASAPIVICRRSPWAPAGSWIWPPASPRRWTAGSATRWRSRRCSPAGSRARTAPMR